jgi:uncharacterized protein (DUF1778 family)
MAETDAVLVQFRATPKMRDWFKDAAHAERKTLSEWLRSMAIVRAAEVVPQPKPISFPQ